MSTRSVRGLVAALVLLVSATACGVGASDAATSPPVDGDAVELSGDQFDPPALRTAAGTTVTWTWNDGATEHNVVFDDGPSSEVLSEGTWTRTFDEPGTYPYVCTLHPQMTGTVMVSDA